MCSELILDVALRRPGFDLAVDHAIALRGVTAVSGPSGSGKTSLLRVIAGLEPGATGHVSAFGEEWQGPKVGLMPAWRRRVGYVFQEAALFDHVNVARNLDYGLERRRAGPSGGAGQRGPERDAIIDTLRLERLLDRMPGRLSGGERQRVALGRCLMSAPRLILLDEPLSAVDHASRSELIPYLQRSLALAGVPAIHVSHSRAELRKMADRVLRMDAGRITASGGSELLLPEGAILLDARVLEVGPEGTRLDIGHLGQRLDLPPGAEFQLMVRRDQVVRISGSEAGVAAAGRIEARVAPPGPDGMPMLEVARQALALPPVAGPQETPAPGEALTLALAGYEVLPPRAAD